MPLDACAEMCRISHQTAWEWRHRLFAAVDGYQDRIVLRGRVWVDETYIDDTDLSKGYGQARKRGLSKQKPCIAVAIDARKEPVAVVCGHGKPSTKRVKGALGGHLAKGATVVHDREKAHNGMIRDAGCESESYKADVRDPVYLERMALVNTSARGSSATCGGSRAWTRQSCSPTSTSACICSGSSGTTRSGPSWKGWSAICS